MKSLVTKDFLLNNETAKKLYHSYAKEMPIIDYHCHLSPQEIAEDKRYESIAEVWLGGDHYKWRLMRASGVDEAYITGNKSAEEKFEKWAEVLPYTIGNPLLHWSDLELVRYFGVKESLTKDNWKEIYNQCNEVVKSGDFSVQKLIEQSNVKWICTTDDPIDTLEYHEQIAANKNFKTTVTPTFRPDKVLRVEEEGFVDYIESLAKAAGMTITTFAELVKAVENRIEFFDAHGCFISDHAFFTMPFASATAEEVEEIFSKRLANKTLTKNEEDQYVTSIFLAMATKYASLNWTMQLHIGALRNVNEVMFEKLGPDTGFDCIADSNYAANLGKIMSALDRHSALPKTVLYDLNAGKNDILATMAGSFQAAGVKSKIQLGTPWWFNDQKNGILNQLTSLSNLGMLSNFVGLLTDSRSFLSYTRHEYFRRILCDYIGALSEAGEITDDIAFLGEIIQNISYTNAYNYFGLDKNPFLQ